MSPKSKSFENNYYKVEFTVDTQTYLFIEVEECRLKNYSCVRSYLKNLVTQNREFRLYPILSTDYSVSYWNLRFPRRSN